MMRTLKVQGGVLRADQVGDLLATRGGKLEALMVELLQTAAGYATPPVSGYSVGAVAAGHARRGRNASPIPRRQPGIRKRAARRHHPRRTSRRLQRLDIRRDRASAPSPSLPPRAATAGSSSGNSRPRRKLVIWSPAAPGEPPQRRLLSNLLPFAFGPADLGLKGGLMSPSEHQLELATDDPLTKAALAAARRSYAPYSKTFAGCAIRTEPGRIIAAPYAENAAFNPSVSPLTVALAVKNIRDPESPVTSVSLFESPGTISHRAGHGTPATTRRAGYQTPLFQQRLMYSGHEGPI